MVVLPADPLPAGLLAGLALVIAAAYAVGRAPGRDLDAGVAYRAALAAAVGGLFGGHALFAATHGAAGVMDWLTPWGSQSFLGVLAGAALSAGAYLRWRRQPLLSYADLAAPGVALGYAVARFGCFLHGDDFGAPTAAAWGVAYPPGTDAWLAHAARGWIAPGAAASLPVVPIQLVLVLVALTIFATLHRARLPRGATVGAAAVAYGVGRFLLEPFRDDFMAVAGTLALPQVLALLLAAGGMALLVAAYGARGVHRPRTTRGPGRAGSSSRCAPSAGARRVPQ